MKKKFLTIFFAIVAALCLCLGLAACGGVTPQEPSGGTQTEQDGGNNQGDGNNTPAPHVHSYGNWEIVVPATHTTTGTRRKYCLCGEHIDETIPKTTAHEFGNWQITREATHLVAGEKQRTCPCGAVETDVIPKTTEHEYGNWQITREATHLVAGEKQRTCPCGEIETETIPKTTAHTFLPYSKQDATCTAAGEEVLRCECGEEQRNTIPQKEHTYDHCECTVCGAIKPGAVAVEVYIDDMLSDTLYTDDEYDHKIQLPEKIVEDEYYFDAWYGNTEYMQPLTGDETYRSTAKIYGRRLALSTFYYSISVSAGEATIESFFGKTDTAVVVPSYYYGYPVTRIGNEAFKDKTMIRWLFIPSPIQVIGSGAFSGCNSMKKVVLPESVTSIGYQAFSDCSGLESVTIGSGVTEIGVSAFSGCSGLTSVEIPGSVTSIGNCAFEGCSGLERVNITDLAAWCKIDFNGRGANPFEYAHHLYLDNVEVKNLTIPAEIKEIKSYTFSGCSGLESVTIGDGVASVANYAFKECTGLTGVYITDLAAWCNIDFWDHYANPLYYAEYLYWDNVKVKDLTIPAEIKEIKQYAFDGYSGLASVTIGDSVTSIGEGAFRGCSKLEKATIKNGTIGKKEFFDCSRLTSVTIESGVTLIEDSAFEGCYNLIEVWNYSQLELAVGDWLSDFAGEWYNNGRISLYAKRIYTDDTPSKQIIKDDYLFYEEGDEVYLFGYVGESTELTLPTTSPSGKDYAIWHYAFYGCSGLTSITIPDGVTGIGKYAFQNCSGLKNVIWNAESCTTSSSCPIFSGCANLKTVSFGENVKIIPDCAFQYCSGLESVPIPRSVTKIGERAFQNCGGLTSVTIGSGVTSIGYGAFSWCSGLTSITIPDSVTSIGRMAFAYCSGLKTVYFKGTPSEWSGISIDSNNSYLTGATRYYFSDNKPTAEQLQTNTRWWHYDEDGETIILWTK